MTREEIISIVTSSVWPIAIERLSAIQAALKSGLEVRHPSENNGKTSTVISGVRVIPIHGVIEHHAGIFTDYFGGTSTDGLMQALQQALRDPEVSAIVFDIDSPGGTLPGVHEAASMIREARGEKPMYALANSTAASAAYWIGSAADKMYAIPSARVGSVGVYALHLDFSKQLESDGVVPTFVYSGKYKVEGNPYEPLADEARAEIQRHVDEAYSQFVSDVAKNRGTSVADVIKNYGQGRVLSAKEAKAAGMIDGVLRRDELFSKIVSRKNARSTAAAASWLATQG